jgi:hypothetical protein
MDRFTVYEIDVDICRKSLVLPVVCHVCRTDQVSLGHILFDVVGHRDV